MDTVSKELEDVERVDFEFGFRHRYKNIWLPWDEQTSLLKVNEEQRELLIGVLSLLEDRLCEGVDVVSISLVRDYVCRWKSKKTWKRFKVYLERVVTKWNQS